MYQNQYDRTLDSVSELFDCAWSKDSKIALFARFLEDCNIPEENWQLFLEKAARTEAVSDDQTCDQCGLPFPHEGVSGLCPQCAPQSLIPGGP